MTSQLLLSEVKKRNTGPKTRSALHLPFIYYEHSPKLLFMLIYKGIWNLNLDLVFTLDKESAVSVDSEDVSKGRKTTERVTNNLDYGNFRNELTNTFTVDHLLSKIDSDSVKIMSCLSPIDGVGLPYFQKYLKPPQKKNVIFIPPFDGVYFQGYIVNITKHKIIHVDSLRWDQPKNPTCIQTAKMLFENSQPTFEFPFSGKKTIYANSCGVWLVAGMSSYLINLPEISDRHNAFDIAYILLERNPVIQKVESFSPQFSI